MQNGALVCPIDHGGGFYRFLVKSNAKKDPHEVAICDTTGNAWCSCDDFWFHQQTNGIPHMLGRVCKHVRLVVEEAQSTVCAG